MSLELSPEEREVLMAGILSTAMAVMAVDMGVVSSAQEAIALGRHLDAAAGRHGANPLIRSLLDPHGGRAGPVAGGLTVTPEDVRSGRLLDRALEDVDRAMALARSRVDEAMALDYARLIAESCLAVAEAAGRGLFGLGRRVSDAERAALARIHNHLGLPC